MLTIKDIMSSKVHTVSRDTDIKTAALKMKRNKVGSVVVMKGNQPVGILTEKDIVEKVIADDKPSTTLVKDVMSTPIYITDPSRDIVGIASIMDQMHINKIPVMSGSKLIGIVTETDIQKMLLEELKLLQKDLSKEKIGVKEYNRKTMQLIDQVNETVTRVKMWHMTCNVCKYKFYAEDDGGVIKHTACPHCGSFDVDYDKGK